MSDIPTTPLLFSILAASFAGTLIARLLSSYLENLQIRREISNAMKELDAEFEKDSNAMKGLRKVLVKSLSEKQQTEKIKYHYD